MILQKEEKFKTPLLHESYTSASYMSSLKESTVERQRVFGFQVFQESSSLPSLLKKVCY